MNFAKPVVDFAASGRSWGSVGKLGPEHGEIYRDIGFGAIIEGF